MSEILVLSPYSRKSYDSASFPGVLFRVTPPTHFSTNLTAIQQYGIQTSLTMPHPFLGKLKYMYIFIIPPQKVTCTSNKLFKKKELTSSFQKCCTTVMPTSSEAEGQINFS